MSSPADRAPRECKACAEVKPLSEFGRHPHGHRWTCLRCNVRRSTELRRERTELGLRGGMPSQEELQRVLDYNPETGKLWWKARGESRSWDTRYAGTEAFTSVWRGYLIGNVLGSVTLRAHRVIFKYVYGREPEAIDHINGNRADNRLCNLRAVTATTNRRNSKRPITNQTGVVGVDLKSSGRWSARIKVDGAVHALGTFVTKGEAIAAREAAEGRFGFHPNHGRAA